MKTPDEWYKFAYDSNEEYSWMEIIEMIQKEAYNQCLEDLINDHVVLNRKETIKKFKK